MNQLKPAESSGNSRPRPGINHTEMVGARTGIPKRCLVSSNVQSYFEELIDAAQDAILSMLGQRTLLQALTELEIRENGNAKGRPS